MLIAIYSNSQVFGGVEVIVLRYCKYLESRNIDYIVVEDDNTKLAKELGLNRIIPTEKFYNISDNVTHIFFPNVCRLIHESLDCDKIPHAKIITWVVHPNEVFTRFFPLGYRLASLFGYRSKFFYTTFFREQYKLVSSLIYKLNEKKALMVMDEACARGLKYFYDELDLRIIKCLPIPVTVDDRDFVIEKKHEQSNEIIFGYFGRMDEMKFSALVPFLKDLRSNYPNHLLRLHFIGVGRCESKLRKLCDKLSISLYEHGYMKNEEARSFLAENTKFCVAMGTSALDLAAVKIPCILLDPTLSTLCRIKPQKRYRMVADIEGYTLGEYRDFPFYKEGSRSLKDCLSNVNEDLALSSMNYVIESHNPEIIFSKLTENLINSRINLSKIGPILIEYNRMVKKYNTVINHFKVKLSR